MKIPNFAICALCLPVALLLSACVHINFTKAPPSKFIGIFGSYNDYANGKIPARTDSYTGPWEDCEGGLRGMYKNGLPAGIWIMPHRSGIPMVLEVYAADNTWCRTEYFPDGRVRSVQNGHLDLEKSERKTDSSVSSEAEWLGIPDFNGGEWNYLATNYAMRIDAGGCEALCDFEFRLNRKDNSFVLWIYAYPADAKNPAPVGKHVLSGRYDVEKGEFADLKTTAKFGNYEIKVGPPDGNTMMPVELFLNGKRIANLPKINVFVENKKTKEQK